MVAVARHVRDSALRLFYPRFLLEEVACCTADALVVSCVVSESLYCLRGVSVRRKMLALYSGGVTGDARL